MGQPDPSCVCERERASFIQPLLVFGVILRKWQFLIQAVAPLLLWNYNGLTFKTAPCGNEIAFRNKLPCNLADCLQTVSTALMEPHEPASAGGPAACWECKLFRSFVTLFLFSVSSSGFCSILIKGNFLFPLPLYVTCDGQTLVMTASGNENQLGEVTCTSRFQAQVISFGYDLLLLSYREYLFLIWSLYFIWCVFQPSSHDTVLLCRPERSGQSQEKDGLEKDKEGWNYFLRCQIAGTEMERRNN